MSFMRWGSKTILQVLHAKGDRGIVETYMEHHDRLTPPGG